MPQQLHKLNAYSNAEMINMLDEQRQRSPVIDLLCTRLEAMEAPDTRLPSEMKCPVCEAELQFSNDDPDTAELI